MASFLSLGLSNAPEISPLPEGEYPLVIKTAKVGSKEGTDTSWIQVILEVPDEPTVPDIFHSLFLPSDSRSEKENAQTLSHIKSFMEAFGMEVADDLPMEDDGTLIGWQGNTGSGILVIDPKFSTRNKISKILNPRR